MTNTPKPKHSRSEHNARAAARRASQGDLPAFIATADAMLENDEDLPDWHFEYDFPAVLQAGFVGYADGIPADARANAITITLDPDDIEELWESRLLSIQNAQKQRAEGRDHD